MTGLREGWGVKVWTLGGFTLRGYYRAGPKGQTFHG